jgi:predicted TPR repeat methyltransferase
MLTAVLLVGVNSLALHGAAQSTDELEGSAFIDEGPTLEWTMTYEAQVKAAEAYVACLRSAEASNWFGEADFTPCDKAREDYASYLADDIVDDVVGCLEVGAVGAARTAERPCERLRERFAESYAERGDAP